MNITKPTLLLDKEKCVRNIQRMVDKANKHNLFFRPHFKTHHSAEVGTWFKTEGVKAITVSSVTMADYFARHGWADITIAFPVNILELDIINQLAKKISLNLLVESINSVDILEKHMTGNTGIFIEIDTGYHRSGVDYENKEAIISLVSKVNKSKLLTFKGYLTHSGQSYHAKSREEIAVIHYDSINKLNDLKLSTSKIVGDEIILSIGDTPGCSMMNDFNGIDEIRPGNFVFYDVMQYELGSCNIDDIAVAMACPVVSKYPQRGEIVIYGGAIHFSKEFILTKNKPVYGYLVDLSSKPWKLLPGNGFLASLSQEHGIIKAEKEILDMYNIGDVIGILPIHSCLTNNLQKWGPVIV